jgi:hypothetical protein
MLRTGFDKLRANGAGMAIVGDSPFVLSLSKHENDFFSTLLGQDQVEAAAHHGILLIVRRVP